MGLSFKEDCSILKYKSHDLFLYMKKGETC